MTYILNIDTTQETAHLRLTRNGELLDAVSNNSQKDHASWIHPAIQSLLYNHGLSPKDLQAVAVAEGPGSYTGLRVGMATAKGICFTAGIPLITLNTLEIIAGSLKNILKEVSDNTLICPMIDARRMEVFTALYDSNLQRIMEPHARILEPDDFQDQLGNRSIHFIGDGAAKWQSIAHHPHAVFPDWKTDTHALSILALRAYENQGFADLAYSEPFYTKDFHSGK